MKLQVLTYQRGEKWFAIGLEHCIYARASSLPEVLTKFLGELVTQMALDRLEGDAPLSETPPAPEEFWERYRTSPYRLVLDVLPQEAAGVVPEIRVAA